MREVLSVVFDGLPTSTSSASEPYTHILINLNRQPRPNEEKEIVGSFTEIDYLNLEKPVNQVCRTSFKPLFQLEI